MELRIYTNKASDHVDLKDTEDTRDTLETKIEVLVDGDFIRKRNRESTPGWSIFPIFILVIYVIDGDFICLFCSTLLSAFEHCQEDFGNWRFK